MSDFDNLMKMIDEMMPRVKRLVEIEAAAASLMKYLHEHVGDTEGFVRLIVSDDGDGIALAERLMALDRALAGKQP